MPYCTVGWLDCNGKGLTLYNVSPLCVASPVQSCSCPLIWQLLKKVQPLAFPSSENETYMFLLEDIVVI